MQHRLPRQQALRTRLLLSEMMAPRVRESARRRAPVAAQSDECWLGAGRSGQDAFFARALVSCEF